MAESYLHTDDLEECKEAEANQRQGTDEFNGLQYEIDNVLIGEVQFPTNKQRHKSTKYPPESKEAQSLKQLGKSKLVHSNVAKIDQERKKCAEL